MNRWPQHKAYFWEYAPFFRVLLPFVMGIVVYEKAWCTHFYNQYWIIGIVILFLLYGVTALLFKPAKISAVVPFILLQSVLFGCGYLVTGLNDVHTQPQWYGHAVNKGATAYLARITDIPAEKEQSWKLQVDMIGAIKRGVVKTEGKAFVYLYKDELPMLLQKGDTVLLPGNWEPIRNAGNPYEFDYAGHCYRNNVVYQQFCSLKQVRLYAGVIPAAASFTERVHDWCMAQLDIYLTNQKTKGLMQAMLLGDEINLDEDLRQSFSDTGIVHVIAISGGNIMLFFGFITVLLWWVRHRKYLWVKYMIALPLVWFYVVMAGASPSAIRAAIMFSVVTLGILFQKNNNSLNQLLATAFVLLCAQPMWLYSIGFQLSFIAVLSLVLFYAPIYKLWLPKNRLLRAIWATICASFAAEVLVAPAVIYYFHNFPLLFLIANVAAYVFMGLVLLSGIAIIAFSWLPVVAKAVGIGTTWLVLAFDTLIKWMQHFNPASFYFLKFSLPELVFIYAALAGITYFIFRQKKLALYSSMGACCVLIALLCMDKWTSIHQQQFVVYNVGNGTHIEYISSGTYWKKCNELSCKR